MWQDLGCAVSLNIADAAVPLFLQFTLAPLKPFVQFVETVFGLFRVRGKKRACIPVLLLARLERPRPM
jgi:hypothetical protein